MCTGFEDVLKSNKSDNRYLCKLDNRYPLRYEVGKKDNEECSLELAWSNTGKCDGYYVIDVSYRNKSDYVLDASFICQDEDELKCDMCDTCEGNYISCFQ